MHKSRESINQQQKAQMPTNRNMAKLGHIRIVKDEIRFVYHELYEPDKKDLIYYHNSVLIRRQLKLEYLKDMKEYQASRREVEVKNVYWSYQFDKWILEITRLLKPQGITSIFVKNNQPCEAEVISGKATIIKIL